MKMIKTIDQDRKVDFVTEQQWEKIKQGAKERREAMESFDKEFGIVQGK